MRSENIAKRLAYVAAQEGLDPTKLVFVDESGLIPCMNRLYGWAPVGKQAIILRSTRGKRLNLIGGMAVDGVRGILTVAGSMNGEKVAEFLTSHLQLNEGDVVVMDNAPVHTAKLARAALAKRCCSVLFLPPYSPDLNPIEHLWSTLKARLWAQGTPTWNTLKELVLEV